MSVDDFDGFKSQYPHRQTNVFDENNKVDRDFINEVQAVRDFVVILADSDDKQKALNSVDIEFIEINTLQVKKKKNLLLSILPIFQHVY
jgi:hypothetical protein